MGSGGSRGGGLHSARRTRRGPHQGFWPRSIPRPTWDGTRPAPSRPGSITSFVKTNGQEFGLQVHTRILPNRDETAYRWTFPVINKITGWYKDYDAMVEPKDYRWSAGKLDIKAPGLSWTGDSVRQSVQVQTPWGALDVQLAPTGPAMNYASTGVFELADGVPNHEFALPEMRTSGTLVVDGKKHQVSGVRCRRR
jgi:hypothetical protein